MGWMGVVRETVDPRRSEVICTIFAFSPTRAVCFVGRLSQKQADGAALAKRVKVAHKTLRMRSWPVWRGRRRFIERRRRLLGSDNLWYDYAKLSERFPMIVRPLYSALASVRKQVHGHFRRSWPHLCRTLRECTENSILQNDLLYGDIRITYECN